MVLRNQSLDFLKANLFDNESAIQNQDEKTGSDGELGNPSTSTYQKRKIREEEAASKKQSLAKLEQVAFLREIMSPASNASDLSPQNSAVNQSIIERNMAYAEDKKSSALHMAALTQSEKVKTLTSIVTNPLVFSLYPPADQAVMLADLLRLAR